MSDASMPRDYRWSMSIGFGAVLGSLTAGIFDNIMLAWGLGLLSWGLGLLPAAGFAYAHIVRWILPGDSQ